MRFAIACFLVVMTGLAPVQQAAAAAVAPNRELERILGKLADTADSDQYRQIEDAVKCSSHLIGQLNGLAASGNLIEIVVLTSAAALNAPKPGPFGAWTAGKSLVFTETLLSQLKKNRAYDVVSPDDILPNNTTFVLGHLAFHPQAGKVPVTSGDRAHLDDYIAATLDQEARAFIQAWNDALDTAIQQNDGKPLTHHQIAIFMLNMRYRFAFLAALRQPTEKIRIEANGVIEESDSNAKAIATALKHSSLADIQ
jgi:hypothetical protein